MRNSTKKRRNRVIDNNKTLREELMHQNQLAAFLRGHGQFLDRLREQDIASIEQLIEINERTIERLGKLL